MNRTKIYILIGGAAALVVTLALIAGAVVTTTIARAQSDPRPFLFQGDTQPTPDPTGPLQRPKRGGPGMRGGLGFPGLFGDGEYLAQALGISVEELEEAYAKAHDAALDQAVANGDLTQEEADAIRTLRDSESEMGRGPKNRLFHFLGRGGVDFEPLLADALGISVEELRDAREEARQLATAAAVDAGRLTEEQADLMNAMAALKDVIDPQALTAQVLGISEDELQDLRGTRGALADLLEEKGLTPAEFRTQMQAAFEAAVQQAVEDGVITQEQADAILEAKAGFGRGMMPPGGFGGRGPGGPCAPDGLNPDSAVPAPPDGSTGTGA